MYWTTIFSSGKPRITEHECSTEEVNKLSTTCRERYVTWKKCVNSLNNEGCKEETLENYYVCVDKLNAIRLHLEKISSVSK